MFNLYTVLSKGDWMMRYIKLVSIFLLLIFTMSAVFSFSQALAAPTTNTIQSNKSNSSESGSKGFLDIILGLLLGNFLGKILNIAPDTADKTPANSLLGLTNTNENSKEVIGFYAEWWESDTASYQSYVKNASQINTIAPFWATLNQDASLTDRGGNDHAKIIQTVHSNNSKVLLLVNNAKQTSDLNPIHTVLSNPALRAKAINNLENYIKKYNMDGVNIDFEAVPSYDRDNLTAFMRELSSRLRPQGYIVTIDVFPKQNELEDIAKAYDYAKLTNYSDKIIIMAYDNHGVWSGAGSIADIKWVENNLKYALTMIPKNKLYLGIAAYGYDWSVNGVESLEHQAINNLIAKYNAKVQWDELSKSPYFKYTDSAGINHEVWFESADSLGLKLELVQKYDIGGIAIWKLGNEDPEYWQVIQKNLSRRS